MEPDEDRAYEIALDDHPEWKQQLQDGTLPDEVVDDDGNAMSPRMHLEMHAIIERQLAADEPPGIVAVARELEELGVSRHEVRHEIGRALVNQVWKIMHENRAFDADEYFRDLGQIVESHR